MTHKRPRSGPGRGNGFAARRPKPRKTAARSPVRSGLRWAWHPLRWLLWARMACEAVGDSFSRAARATRTINFKRARCCEVCHFEIAKRSLFATFLILQILQNISRHFMRRKMACSRSFHAPALDIRDAMRPTSATATTCAWIRRQHLPRQAPRKFQL